MLRRPNTLLTKYGDLDVFGRTMTSLIRLVYKSLTLAKIYQFLLD